MFFENKTLILQAQNVAFEIIQVLENEWTQVYLQIENERHFLGAERFEYIRQRLNNAFDENQQRYAGFINSEPVSWVLTLSETHCTIYANSYIENLKFYIQNKNAEIKFVFELSSEEKRIWKEKLTVEIN